MRRFRRLSRGRPKGVPERTSNSRAMRKVAMSSKCPRRGTNRISADQLRKPVFACQDELRGPGDRGAAGPGRMRLRAAGHRTRLVAKRAARPLPACADCRYWGRGVRAMVNLPGGRHPRTDRDKKVAVDVTDGLGPSRGSGAFRRDARGDRSTVPPHPAGDRRRAAAAALQPSSTGVARRRRYTVPFLAAQTAKTGVIR